MKTVAILSMLHQEAACADSASRLFRGEAVLGWTLKRLGICERIEKRVVVCWEDQAGRVAEIAEKHGAAVRSKGPRVRLGGVEMVAAARRWSDGWRGGLLGACCFDLGFHAATVEEARRESDCDAVVLIDPDSALVDGRLVDSVIGQAEAKEEIEYCFSPAAPGAGGVVVKANLLGRLAGCDGTLGRMMAYWPDVPGRDPIAAETCAATPTIVARTTRRLTLDSARQVALVERAAAGLNGRLIKTGAEDLLRLLEADAQAPFPRDVVLEINTARATSAVYRAKVERPPVDMQTARKVLDEVAKWDDVRLTLSGAGDALLHDQVIEIIGEARQRGVRAVHVETDFVGISQEKAAALAESGVDVVSVHIPALTAATYAAVMGVNALAEVLGNIKAFFARREALGKSTPLLVPTFTKVRQNMAEMEAWYDHWLRAVGCAVIDGASDYAGSIADQSPVDMSPAGRCACRRLSSRLMILSDGRVTTCEIDVLGKQAVGNIHEKTIEEMWRGGLGCARRAHREQGWAELTVCGGCRDWHRP